MHFITQKSLKIQKKKRVTPLLFNILELENDCSMAETLKIAVFFNTHSRAAENV